MHMFFLCHTFNIRNAIIMNIFKINQIKSFHLSIHILFKAKFFQDILYNLIFVFSITIKRPNHQKPERYLSSILNYLEHFLRHRFLLLLFNLRLRFPKLFHPFQFFLSIIESDMRIHIHCDRYIRPMRYCNVLGFIPDFAIFEQ